MKEKSAKVILTLLKRGVRILISDKFSHADFNAERDMSSRLTEISVMVEALGETLEEIEAPTEWRRFLKRKDCPAYLKKTTTYKINAYYPKLSLPEEKNWIAIDK